jgi:hypothetical protein
VTVTSISLVGALTALVPPAIDVELGDLALIGGNDLFGEEPAVESPSARGSGFARSRWSAALGDARWPERRARVGWPRLGRDPIAGSAAGARIASRENASGSARSPKTGLRA